jgi:hypothetical protein
VPTIRLSHEFSARIAFAHDRTGIQPRLFQQEAGVVGHLVKTCGFPLVAFIDDPVGGFRRKSSSLKSRHEVGHWRNKRLKPRLENTFGRVHHHLEGNGSHVGCAGVASGGNAANGKARSHPGVARASESSWEVLDWI